MLLKRLELLGFKSFATRATFELEPGISVLVGPNGSGKSNVADAVRWVLGEQNPRALRSKRAEEVIFVGSSARHPLGMAEVALVFDNSARRLPLEYAEVRLARRLYRSGESEYLLNGGRVRRKDLVGLLLGVGLHTEGYTVIGQGAVEELVMQRPDERRAVLEHAADISRHQARLAEARAKLSATEDNLTRCRDLVAELEPHARRLRAQADKAERYSTRRAELGALARAYYRAALAERRAAERSAATALSEVTAESERLEAEVAELERGRGSVRDDLTALDGELARLRRRLDELHAERDGRLAEVAAGRQRVGFLEAQAEGLAGEAERAARRLAELGEDDGPAPSVVPGTVEVPIGVHVEQLETEVERLAAELRAARRTHEETRAAQARHSQERLGLEREGERQREREARERQAAADEAARRGQLEARLGETVAEAEGLERDLRAVQERERDARTGLAAGQADRQAARTRVVEARQREQAARRDLDLARANLAAGRAETASHSGPETEALAGPERLGSSFLVEPEFEPAIAAALGEWAAAGLVSDSERACTLLAGERSGRVLYQVARSGPDRAGAQRFQQAVGPLLAGIWHRFVPDLLQQGGNGLAGSLGPLEVTVLVRDLAAARLAAERLGAELDSPWQVASLAGQVITHGGGWARGWETAAERLVSRRRREAECRTRVERLEPLLERAEQERRAAERATDGAEARERELQALELSARAESRLLTRRREELLNLRRRLEDSLSRAPGRGAEQAAAPSGVDWAARRDALAASLAALVQQEQAATDRLQGLQARWEVAWGEREQARRVVEQADAEQRARQERQAARRREVERLEGERGAALLRAERSSEELKAVRTGLEETEQQASELAAAITDAGRETGGLATGRVALLAGLERAEHSVADLRRQLGQARPRREAALLAHQQASDGLAHLRAEAEATAEEWGLAGEAMVQLRLLGQPTRPEEGHPTSDAEASTLAGGASTLDELLGADEGASSPEPPVDPVSAKRRLVALQRELRSYGAISESVRDEYREVEQRLDFLTSQSADLRAAMQDLLGVIDELEGLMRQGFGEAFGRVNAVFAQTFATLFGGGTARLTLTEPNDPLRTGVDIVAQPPGKRLQSLISLSGGERALTSTALIFALLATNPLPFCVLDEVDAALDEPNARRFAALLREYAERTQFIIITHNRVTMETAQALYGISMAGDGVTTVVSLRPSDALVHARNGQAADRAETLLQA